MRLPLVYKLTSSLPRECQQESISVYDLADDMQQGDTLTILYNS